MQIFEKQLLKKKIINEANGVKRLEFANVYANKLPEFQKKVIFSDEWKFNIFGSDDKKNIQRKPNISHQIKNLKLTIKYSGGHKNDLGMHVF